MAEQSAIISVSGSRYLHGYNCALVGVMLLASVLLIWQGFQLPSLIVCGAIVIQLLLSVGVWFVLWRGVRQNPKLYFLVFILSVVNFGLYLYGAGGHTNPAISILLVPVALSAVLLHWKNTIILALLVVSLYTLLTSYFLPLSAGSQGGHHGAHQHDNLMQFHLLGMWLTFAISTALICVLVIPLARSVRRQQALIAHQSEKLLQDEQLVSLATFAASSAHKMGTPLCTLSILVDDFSEVVAGKPEWQKDRDLMVQQISMCKNILQEMVRKAEDLRQNSREPMSVSELVGSLREQFNLLHPQLALQVDSETPQDVQVLADATLEQALLNLLDNAVRASKSAPQMSIKSKSGNLVISIKDAGPGVPEDIRQQLGQPFVSARKDGLGLGLFLSHATINRLHGELNVRTGVDGTVAEISLPLFEMAQQVDL
ncbi:MAG: HAMP domain-containing histidine kinase [Ketobacter sp.]|nr:HAMP domain-containing histidine kinase [Ketobacter sp.]